MFESIVLAASVVILVVTLPGTIELTLLTLGALLRRSVTSIAGRSAHKIALAVIVPVHNEERGLGHTLRSILDCENPVDPKDVVVVACNTTDRSVEIAQEMGCTVLERIDPTRRGKGYGLDFAFKALNGCGYDAYLIVDADTTVDRSFLTAFRAAFAAGAEAVQCILRVANPGANTRNGLLNIAFLAFTFLRPLSRHRLGLSAGIFGNGFGVRSDILKRIPYRCYSITEDLEYHLELVKSDVRVEFVSATSVSADMLTTDSGARSQRERWEGGRLGVMFLQAPKLLREIVLRRKIKLIEPLLDLLLLPLVYHALLLVILAILSSSAVRIYAVAGLLLVVAHILQAMIIGNAGRSDWKALGAIPAYVSWKVLYLGGVVKAAGKATPWTRTERLRKP